MDKKQDMFWLGFHYLTFFKVRTDFTHPLPLPGGELHVGTDKLPFPGEELMEES